MSAFFPWWGGEGGETGNFSFYFCVRLSLWCYTHVRSLLVFVAELEFFKSFPATKTHSSVFYSNFKNKSGLLKIRENARGVLSRLTKLNSSSCSRIKEQLTTVPCFFSSYFLNIRHSIGKENILSWAKKK